MKEKRFFELLGFRVMVLTIGGLTAYASPTPLNGDFSAALNGWTVEYGYVSDGGGYALFQEHPIDLSSTLSQEFTIPDLALELSFDVDMWATPISGETIDQSATLYWPDTFTVSLLDADFNPLISWDPLVTEFFLLDNQPVIKKASGVTISGNTISLPISSDWAGQDVLLSFDLWASYDGKETTVNLDNVNISVIPAPGALLLGLMGTGAVGLWRRLRPR